MKTYQLEPGFSLVESHAVYSDVRAHGSEWEIQSAGGCVDYAVSRFSNTPSGMLLSVRRKHKVLTDAEKLEVAKEALRKYSSMHEDARVALEKIEGN